MSPSHTSNLGWRETSNQCYWVGWLLPPIAALTVSVHLCFWLLGCSKLCCLSDTFESLKPAATVAYGADSLQGKVPNLPELL